MGLGLFCCLIKEAVTIIKQWMEMSRVNISIITQSILAIFTRCAYAQGRVKRLSPSYLFVDVCVVKKHGCLLSYRSKIATK